MNRPKSTAATPPDAETEGTAPRPTAASRRLRTIAFGAIPVVALASLTVMDHIPGTDISLTVPYAAEGQGPMFDTLGEIDGTEVVEIEGADTDETDGELYMTTVSVRTQMTLAQALGRWIASEDTIVPLEQVVPPNRTPDEVEEANKAAFTASEAAATVAAMNHLGAEIEVVVADTVAESPADGQLEPEDVITAVDGEAVDEPGQVQERVRALDPGAEVTLTVRRGGGDGEDDENGEEIDVTLTLAESEDGSGTPMIGVLMASQPVDDIDVNYNLQDVGGPSAGMVFSLAVIDKLSPGELTGGHSVAGTGTIAEDGAVGPIGGIEHKVSAARDNGVELFLSPAANCAAATSRDTGDMVVASVDTLDDAIAAMDDFAAGDEVETCT